MKKLITIALVISTLFACAACQPTPSAPIVQSKNDGKLEQKIAADEKPSAKYEAPEHWQDSISSKAYNLTIDIDADVVLPETECYPVVRIQKTELAKKFVMKMVGRLSTDGKTYSYKNELVLTKPEVADIIKQLMDDMADPNSNINSPRISEEERARLKKEREQEIAEWQSYYKKAPDKFEATEIPIDFAVDNVGGGYFDCGINMGSKSMTELYISCYPETGGEVLINISDGRDTGEIIRYTDDFAERNNLEMTPDEAVETGLDFIKKMDDGDFSAALIRCGYMLQKEQKEAVTDYPECYEIYFTRSYEGVNSVYDDYYFAMSLVTDRMSEKLSRQSEYAQYLPPESIRLIITDKGVAAAQWIMPSYALETVNKNVELLPFDKIQSIFRQQMSVEGLLTNVFDAHIKSRRVVITKAVLGMTQMREKNTVDGYIMVPAWSFFGYEVYSYEKQQAGGFILNENNEYVNDQLQGHSFLTINAVDGSIINPIVGY